MPELKDFVIYKSIKFILQKTPKMLFHVPVTALYFAIFDSDALLNKFSAFITVPSVKTDAITTNRGQSVYAFDCF